MLHACSQASSQFKLQQLVLLRCVLCTHCCTSHHTTDYVNPVELLQQEEPVTAEKEEEVNILYVALTRARYRLVLNSSKYYKVLHCTCIQCS
jgi:ATP-dependent exoDNAse (exonuclease V) beta subunit